MAKILLAVGGTGGHIYPAVALGRQIRETVPGSTVCIAGKEGGQEQRIAGEYGFDFYPVRIARMPERKAPVPLLRFGGDVAASVASGISLVGKVSPDAVVGFGGHVSFPTVIGAAVRRVPAYIHEQNALAGKANLALARFAKGVFASYESTVEEFGEKAVLTGNPSRYEGFVKISKEEARQKLNLDPDRKTIFVFGGSQGAVRINEAVFDFAERKKDAGDIQLLHLTGRNNFRDAVARYEKSPGKDAAIRIEVREYLNEMELAYCSCDIAVCRSGATTISELTSMGVPSILVPFPYATGNHQYLNARELSMAGAALIIEDRELTGELLEAEIESLIASPEKIEKMSEKSAGLYRPGAAKKMTEIILRGKK